MHVERAVGSSCVSPVRRGLTALDSTHTSVGFLFKDEARPLTISYLGQSLRKPIIHAHGEEPVLILLTC